MTKIKTILANVDWKKWGTNTLTFSAPFLIVFLVAIQGGKSFKDAMYVLYLYILNVAIDFLKKFLQAGK